MEQENKKGRFKVGNVKPEAEEGVEWRGAKWRQGDYCNGPDGKMIAVTLEMERGVEYERMQEHRKYLDI